MPGKAQQLTVRAQTAVPRERLSPCPGGAPQRMVFTHVQPREKTFTLQELSGER
jgi:hypothetical protein